jgi:hypothetical protein
MPIGNGCYRVRFADGRLQEVHGAAEAVAVILDGLPDDGALRPQTQSGFETAAGHRASGSAPRLARPGRTARPFPPVTPRAPSPPPGLPLRPPARYGSPAMTAAISEGPACAAEPWAPSAHVPQPPTHRAGSALAASRNSYRTPGHGPWTILGLPGSV